MKPSILHGWGHALGPPRESEAVGPVTPEHASYEDFKQHDALSSSSSSAHDDNHSSLVAVALSILQKVPGAKTVSQFNAVILALLGLAAALAALAGGSAALLALLARWYLPAQQTQYSLPIYFDYAAGPSAAGAWLPLLRHTAVTASLTPPPQQQPPPTSGLTFYGNVGPGGSFSVKSDQGLHPAVSASAPTFANQLGFLGLGFGPGSRHAATVKSIKRGWFGRRNAKQQRGTNDAVGGGEDVGSGVMVPEVDWLVPSWGSVDLSIELEMPPWPESDLVQVTSELVSQQGIVLGRHTRTWVPKPKPLLHRIFSFFVFGPWRALGLVDDAVKVSMPMFEGFHNPLPPPGGWSSVPGLLQTPKEQYMQCGGVGSSASDSDAGRDVEGGGYGSSTASTAQGGVKGSAAEVAGPRAMWLRVRMIGRSVGYGPPKVYRAAAKLQWRLGLLDRLAVALRPTLPTLLLLLSIGSVLTVGGGSTAAVLLLLAYSLYRWASKIEHAGEQYDAKDGTAAAAAEPTGAIGEEEGSLESHEEGYYEPSYETDRDMSEFSGAFMEHSGLSARESGVHADKVAHPFSPAVMNDEQHDYFEYSSRSKQQHQQQQEGADDSEPTDHRSAYAFTSSNEQPYIPSPTKRTYSGDSNSSGAVTAIKRMFGYDGSSTPAAVVVPTAAGTLGSVLDLQGAAAVAAAAAAAEEGEDEEELMHDIGITAMTGHIWQSKLLAADEQQEQQQQQQQRKPQREFAAAPASAGQEHSSQTAASLSRRAGYSFEL